MVRRNIDAFSAEFEGHREKSALEIVLPIEAWQSKRSQPHDGSSKNVKEKAKWKSMGEIPKTGSLVYVLVG